jgi:hypothetical protein
MVSRKYSLASLRVQPPSERTRTSALSLFVTTAWAKKSIISRGTGSSPALNMGSTTLDGLTTISVLDLEHPVIQLIVGQIALGRHDHKIEHPLSILVLGSQAVGFFW